MRRSSPSLILGFFDLWIEPGPLLCGGFGGAGVSGGVAELRLARGNGYEEVVGGEAGSGFSDAADVPDIPAGGERGTGELAGSFQEERGSS